MLHSSSWKYHIHLKTAAILLTLMIALSGCRAMPASTSANGSVTITSSSSISKIAGDTTTPVQTASGLETRIGDIRPADLNKRLTIQGTITEIERLSGGNTLLQIRDQTGTLPVFFEEEAKLDRLALSVGLHYRVNGVLQQYKDAMELVPTSGTDIVLMNGYDFEPVNVVRVSDGDTITVQGADGTSRRIRIIGVDSPEMSLDGKPAEFFADEAKAFTEKTLLNRTVYLERDNSDTDPYGRQLRYVWLSLPATISLETLAKANFSAILITGGFAAAYRSGHDDKYREQLICYEEAAKTAKTGMWQ